MDRKDTAPSAAEVEAVRQQFATKADQIRALDRGGYKRARIADALGLRYQHVRNVLEFSAPARGMAEAGPPEGALSPPPVQFGNTFRFTIEAGGKITLPAELIQRLGAAEGRQLIGQLSGEMLELFGPLEGARRAQALTPQWQEGEPLWSEEVIVERRAEARRE